MLLECRHCGAPLDVRAGERTTRCRYCGTTSATRSLRTVSPETPANWRPPPVWTPPPHVAADPRVSLKYHRANTLVLAILGATATIAVAFGFFMTTAASIRTAAGPRGAGAPVAPSGLAPEKLASITMRERAEDLAKLPGATLVEKTRVRVPLASPAWSTITFEWDAAHPEHVRQFYLNGPSSHPSHGEARRRLEDLLPKRWTGETFGWRGVSLHVAPSSGGLNVNVSPPDASGGGSTYWKEQIELMWRVVQSAALGLPAQVDPAAVRDYLGGGYPLATLAKIDLATDVDASAAAIKKLFPGTPPEKRIQLTYHVAIDHPWFGTSELGWENAPGGKLLTVYIRPPGSGATLAHQDRISACVGEGFGLTPRITEADYLAKKRYYGYDLKGGGAVWVYDTMIMIRLSKFGSTPPMTQASWERLLALLDACGRQPAR
ncbi:hypothetical protein [Sorangium sp. So ce1097]|uniref:hypothetical protein n=1 Tax=Sorangium sp. So ce1097 TaxID=3133330 RepID=UPI003F61812E